MTLETRETILEAALRCFSRTGYHKTSMDDVVKEANLSKGGVYWHFKSKQALFMALFEYIIAKMTSNLQLQSADAPTLAPREELLGLLLAAGAAMDALPQALVSVSSFLIEMWKLPGFWEAYKKMLSPYVKLVCGVVEKGIEAGVFRPVPVEETVWSIMAALDGVMLYAMLGEQENFDVYYQHAVTLLVDGLCLPQAVPTPSPAPEEI